MSHSGKDLKTPVLKVKNKKDIPDDAVMLTKQEAIDLQWQLVMAWKPRRDTWPYTIGISSLGTLAGLTGWIINNQYRKRLNLYQYAPLVTFLPLVIVPVFLTSAIHAWLVASEVMIGNYTCPMCMETRAAVAQVGCGMIYPLLLGPVTTFYMAGSSYRYAIPNIWDYKNMYSLYKTVNKRLGSKLLMLFTLQVIAAATVTKLQMNSIQLISEKMVEKEDSKAKSRSS